MKSLLTPSDAGQVDTLRLKLDLGKGCSLGPHHVFIDLGGIHEVFALVGLKGEISLIHNIRNAEMERDS